jgi:hypothetical protein
MLKKLLKYSISALIILIILSFTVPWFFRDVLGGKAIVDNLNYTWIKSDQPERDNLPKCKKYIVKLSYGDSFLKVILINLVKSPALIKNYFQFKDAAYNKTFPIKEELFSVSVSFDNTDFKTLKGYLDELGVKHVLVRVPYYRGKVFSGMDRERIREGIRFLLAESFDVTISIPQSREAVNDIASWKAHITETFNDFYPDSRYFIIGHLPNRGKWGIWDFGMKEYKSLFLAAREVAANYRGIKLIGPSVIDFEWEYMLANLESLKPGDIDVVNANLYVDRVKAPENTQMGFDTGEKVTLVHSIADMYRKGIPLWITEVNWAIKGTGEYSPAAGSVTEEQYANYLVRYNVLSACTGFVDRIYWWQLIHKGFGLIDGARKRPGFYALKTLRAELIGSAYISKESDGNYYKFTFRKGNELIHLMWAKGKKITMTLPKEGRIVNRNGAELGSAKTITLGEEPVYVHVPA